MNLLFLPDEILIYYIFSYFYFEEIIKINKTCKKIYAIYLFRKEKRKYLNHHDHVFYDPYEPIIKLFHFHSIKKTEKNIWIQFSDKYDKTKSGKLVRKKLKYSKEYHPYCISPENKKELIYKMEVDKTYCNVCKQKKHVFDRLILRGRCGIKNCNMVNRKNPYFDEKKNTIVCFDKKTNKTVDYSHVHLLCCDCFSKIEENSIVWRNSITLLYDSFNNFH